MCAHIALMSAFLPQIYTTLISAAGIVWLAVFHVDITLYKNRIVRKVKEKINAFEEQVEKVSVTTEMVLGDSISQFNWNDDGEYAVLRIGR